MKMMHPPYSATLESEASKMNATSEMKDRAKKMWEHDFCRMEVQPGHCTGGCDHRGDLPQRSASEMARQLFQGESFFTLKAWSPLIDLAPETDCDGHATNYPI
jgi:hypothetical protein